MPEDTYNALQPPSPFDDSSPVPEEIELSGPGGFKAIDFQASYQQLSIAADYLNETKRDFERAGEPYTGVEELEKKLKAALKKIRDLEVSHVEDTVERADEFGGTQEVLVRIQDPQGFDEVVRLYHEATTLFEAYFEKHVQLIKEGKVPIV